MERHEGCSEARRDKEAAVRKTVTVPEVLYSRFTLLARSRGYSSLSDYLCEKLRHDEAGTHTPALS